jgi:hypothetical protein
MGRGDDSDDNSMEPAAAWMLEGTQRSAEEIAKHTLDEANKRFKGRGGGRGAGPSQGGGSGSSKKDDLLMQLVKVLASLAIANSRDLRELTGTVFHCFLFDVGHLLVVELQKTGKEYFEKVKDNKMDHKEGPPFLHMWVTLVRVMCQHPDLPKEAKAVLMKYWNTFVTKKPRAELESEVRHCRCRLTHNKQQAKITFAVSQSSIGMFTDPAKPTLEQAIVATLEAMKGLKKVGPPPAAHLEREAIKLLERFS